MGLDDLTRSAEAIPIRPDSLLRQLEAATPKYPIPDVPSLPMPALINLEDRHRSESAGDFVSRLAHQIRSWEKQIPQDAQSVVLAVLPNGLTVDVTEVCPDGHNLVRLTGTVNGTHTMLLAHQAALQVVCYIRKADGPHHRIGFSTDHREGSQDTPAEPLPGPSPGQTRGPSDSRARG